MLLTEICCMLCTIYTNKLKGYLILTYFFITNNILIITRCYFILNLMSPLKFNHLSLLNH